MAKERLKIKLRDVRMLAGLRCTKAELAAFLKISPTKLNDIMKREPALLATWEQGQEMSKISLRRKQFRLASTSAPMAIFLGKQILEQRDVSTTELTGKDGKPIETMDLSVLNPDERKNLRDILTRAQQPATPAK